MSLRSGWDQAAYEHERFGEPFPDPCHNQWYDMVDAITDFVRDIPLLWQVERIVEREPAQQAAE